MSSRRARRWLRHRGRAAWPNAFACLTCARRRPPVNTSTSAVTPTPYVVCTDGVAAAVVSVALWVVLLRDWLLLPVMPLRRRVGRYAPGHATRRAADAL